MPLPQMVPAVRAIADRLMWEGAIISAFADLLPEGATERTAGGGDWTVAQVFAHLAINERLHADNLERYLRGEVPRPPGFDINQWNAETVGAARVTPVSESLDMLAQERSRLYTMFSTIDDRMLERDFILGRTLGAALPAWAGHYAEHAFDIIEVVPELHLAPIIVRWLARLDLDANPALAERQTRFIGAVRTALANLDEADAVEAGGPGGDSDV